MVAFEVKGNMACSGLNIRQQRKVGMCLAELVKPLVPNKARGSGRDQVMPSLKGILKEFFLNPQSNRGMLFTDLPFPRIFIAVC